MSKENDNFYKKPAFGPIHYGVAAVLAFIGIKTVDPQLVDSAMQQLGTLTHGGLSSVGLSSTGGVSCADLDKQYHFVSPAQAGGYKFNGPQTASCVEIQRALEAHHSPMASQEPGIYKAYADAGINNGAAMGIAWHEGNYGTSQGIQQGDENIGAMRYASPSGYPNPNFSNDNGWMDFHTADQLGQPTGWVAGAQDHAALIDHWINYNGVWNGTFKHGGDGRVDAIIPILSPSADHNNVPAYEASVKSTMDTLYHESVDYQQQHPDALATSSDITSVLSADNKQE